MKKQPIEFRKKTFESGIELIYGIVNHTTRNKIVKSETIFITQTKIDILTDHVVDDSVLDRTLTEEELMQFNTRLDEMRNQE